MILLKNDILRDFVEAGRLIKRYERSRPRVGTGEIACGLIQAVAFVLRNNPNAQIFRCFRHTDPHLQSPLS